MFFAAWSSTGVLTAQTILWNSDANAVNLDSCDQPMNAEFRFELGVFEGAFVPDPDNAGEWAEHWNAAMSVSYDAGTKRFAGSFVPAHNDAPFSIGKAVYVWGFRGDPASGEWILFRAPSWTFPDANPFVPPPLLEWYAKDAVAVIGEINSSGVPFLMKSARVEGGSPPVSWESWKADYLTDEPLDGPDDDPDNDGVPNLLEFVFGTHPREAGPAPVTVISLVAGRLRISIPRIKERAALLSVQVSLDLENWDEGADFTEVIEDGPDTWVVRDRTPFPATGGRRFMRLKATLPPP